MERRHPPHTLFPYTTLFRSAKGHTIGINSVAFSKDGTAVVTAGLDRVLKLWDVNGLKERQVFRGHTGMIYSVAFRSEEHTSELQSRFDLVCRLLLEKKNENYRLCSRCLRPASCVSRRSLGRGASGRCSHRFAGRIRVRRLRAVSSHAPCHHLTSPRG